MFQKVAKPSCENAAWGDYFLLEIQSRILESSSELSESAKAICLPCPGPITTFDVQSQLKKCVGWMKTHIKVIAFCRHKLAHLFTRPKRNYLLRSRSKLAFPLLVQRKETINIFCMMKRIKMITETIYWATNLCQPF